MTVRVATSDKQGAADLRERWERLARERPGRFASEIAQELGVSEGELLATKIQHGSVRLKKEWVEILSALSSLGEVKAITRNEFAVLEKNGRYPEFQHFGMHSMFVGEAIDMRISLREWQSALAVRNPGRQDGAESRSIQFFGRDGTAVHKLFLTSESNEDAYRELVARFADEDQGTGEQFATDEESKPLPDETIDRAALLDSWSALTDTHGFFGLLDRFRVTRPQAMRLAEERFTRRVDNGSVRSLLTQVSANQVPVMLFIGNKGALQISKGPLQNIVPARGWLNVMDGHTEMHLKEEQVADSWVVLKPTADGEIRSLELFDTQGRDVLSVFGVRTEGKRQSAEWHASLEKLH